MTDLLKVQDIDPIQFFTDGGVLPLLSKIREQADALTFDVSTDDGVADCKKAAREVASIVNAVDKIGKDYLADLKNRCKPIDQQRKIWRDGGEKIKAKVRAPVTTMEQAELARLEEIKRQQEADEEARRVELAKKEQEMKEREAAVLRAEREAAAKVEAERMAKEREERARVEAENAAARRVQEAEEKAARAERERLGAIQQQREAAERAEREAQAREERAKLQAQEEARREAERIERERYAQEAAKVQQAAKEAAEVKQRAANKEHRDKIHAQIVYELGAIIEWAGIEQAIEDVAAGQVQHLTINYEV